MKKSFLIAGGALALIVGAAAIAVPAMTDKPKADADGNGVISKAEAIAQAETRFKAMDTNADGKISPEDREARSKKRFAEMDADKNGTINEAEFAAHHAARMEMRGQKGEGRMGRRHGGHRGHGGMEGGHGMALLSKADSNGDKILTQTEYRAAAETRFIAADTDKNGSLSGCGTPSGQSESAASRYDARKLISPVKRCPASSLPLCRVRSGPVLWHRAGIFLGSKSIVAYFMHKTRPHLLLVDDEVSIRDPLARYLERQGYRVTEAEQAAAARTALSSYDIDVVVLDIMMPGEDGLSLTRHIAESGGPPVILLTAKTEETDRIVGLEIGADDYVVKPFSPRELVARIKVALRRGTAPARKINGESAGYRFGGWQLRTAEQQLFDPTGVMIPLSSGEYRLLEALVERAGQVLNRDQLLDLTRGRLAGPFDRAVDNQISRLRRKLEPDPKDPAFIKTIWGGGYRFSVDVERL